MQTDYYVKKYGISLAEIKLMSTAFVSDFPSEIIELSQVATSAQLNEINELKQTQSKLLNNHLFLYDVLDNSDSKLREKLRTNYTKIPENLAFKDQKIIDILNK